MTPQVWTAEEAVEGTKAFFSAGRCSGHAQFNGRYCRDVAGLEQWCIHCAGYVLLSALTAATERETALRKENERLKAMVAHVEDAFRESIEQIQELPPLSEEALDAAYLRVVQKHDGRAERAESALAAERQKVQALREWLIQFHRECDADEPSATWAVEGVMEKLDALHLTGTPQPSEEGSK